MKWLILLAWLWPALAWAQSATVLPSELALSVSVEEGDRLPYEREMVLLTIRGEFRRHITRETLVQPDFDGFSWAQLGPDTWTDERIDGKLVKVFTRRMAIYPNRSGQLTIGAFTHKLTLTDAGDDWFDHQITSAPVTVQVAPAPGGADWWFPVKQLRISDRWSNAPDQLQPGEGVLRIVRVEALGVTPEMIPPMPDLTSPSAMIFPHPEQRLVELTPEGPMTYAFWRWTIRPSNDVSTIVEPLRFEYFDSVHDVAREVTISAQRVSYGTVTRSLPIGADQSEAPEPGQLPGVGFFVVGLAVFAVGLLAGLRGRVWDPALLRRRVPGLDPLVNTAKRAARRGQAPDLRRAIGTLLHRDGTTPTGQRVLDQLDRAIFDPKMETVPALPTLLRSVLAARRGRPTGLDK